VELAAAKIRVMSVAEIERRLDSRFSLLRGGSRDAPERHQTLLAVIDWSWNLLTEEQRVALRRLSVFRDGFTIEGATAVVGPDALDLVTALADQSLVTVQEGERVRFRLLETVREFGRMQLVDAGDDLEASGCARGRSRSPAGPRSGSSAATRWPPWRSCGPRRATCSASCGRLWGPGTSRRWSGSSPRSAATGPWRGAT
jgi:predicted ATPase